MNVSELIDLVGELAFSRSTLTAKTRDNYCKFLNLANLELWQILVNSSFFFQSTDIFLSEDGFGSLPDSYYLKAVFSGNRRLARGDLNNLFSTEQGYYFLLNGKIKVNGSGLPTKEDPSDGTSKSYINAIIVPNCKTLVEEVENEETQIDTPVFAEPHHLSLVHGALYYLYISGKGFTEKLKYQLNAWEIAKKNFQTFYG